MSDVKITISAIDAASSVLNNVAKNVQQLGGAVERQGGGFGAFGQIAVGALRQVGAAAVSLAGAGVSALAAQLRTSVGVAADFEQSLYRFKAVAGDSLSAAGVSFSDVKQKALELGSSTQFSAQQALDAMTALSKGGVAVSDVMTGATDATLNLAAAAQLDLSVAAEVVAKQLGVWGSSGVTAANVADALASAANASTVNVQELALGLANAGGSAKTAGLSFQETVQTLALIAPNFSSAADAGTSMKTFLNRLIPTTKDATQAMIDLGLATSDGKSVFFDAQGQFVGMEQASRLLHDATQGLSEEQKLLALNTIFGSDAIRAAAAIAEAGAEGYNAMGESMTAAGGAAVAAATMQQGYSFALDQFNAAMETLQITIGSAMLPALTALLKAAASGISIFTEWVGSILNATDPLAALTERLGIVGITTERVQQVIATAAAAIQSVWTRLSSDLSTSTNEAWSSIQSLISTVTAYIQQAIQAATDIIRRIWSSHGDEILSFSSSTWSGIMGVVSAAAQLIQAVIEALVQVGTWIWNNFGTEITAIAQFAWAQIQTTVQTSLAVISGLLTAATAVLRGDWAGAWEAIKGVAEAIWAAMRSSAENLMTALSSIFQSIGPRIESAWRAVVAGAASLGADLINGITSGVTSAASSLAASVAQAARRALDAAKSALRIKSPSQVAENEIGVPLAQGILRGLADGLQPLPLITRNAVLAPSPATVNVGGIHINTTAGMDERRVAVLVRNEIDTMTRFARFGRM